MITMIEYLLEPFLMQFYLLESVCGHFMTEKAKSKMFDQLAKVFCIPESEELKEYYRESNLEHFKTITDCDSYERFCRMIEFAEKSGQNVELSDSDRIILAQKREAMMIKSNIFKQGKNLTKENVSSILLNYAMDGNIDAMAVLAYMEYHGICICKDTRNAMKRIRLCANWNNVFGNLMGIAYDTENEKKYYDNLYTILRNASQKRIFKHICEFNSHNENCGKNPVARIIEKAFGMNIVRRDTYDRVFAKIAFSELISVEDKEKLLLNKQKDAIVSLSDIPFDVKCDGQLYFDENNKNSVALKRNGELKKIMQNLTVAMRCPGEVYTPLLIVSSDDYVADMYSTMLKNGFAGTPVIEIDAGTLTCQDFSGAKENVLLRGLSETKTTRTVFMIKHCEDMEDEQLDELVKVLDYEYRKKFKLFNPNVSLDLSGVLFILFAGEKNSQVMRLSEYCDTVLTQRISADEKNAVVDSVFSARSSSFGCKSMTMEDGCREYLASYDTKQIQQIIDSALRSAVYERKQNISLTALKSVCREQNISQTKRGFGYMGGNYYA